MWVIHLLYNQNERELMRYLGVLRHKRNTHTESIVKEIFLLMMRRLVGLETSQVLKEKLTNRAVIYVTNSVDNNKLTTVESQLTKTGE